eukprot:GHVU01185503.1.p1 GENE.GHVU01185503.1~~GHVU01185503.1.p1  ORF type:complete len:158 (+),score=7.07 GHVU01185503.1:58-474(+)
MGQPLHTKKTQDKSERDRSDRAARRHLPGRVARGASPARATIHCRHEAKLWSHSTSQRDKSSSPAERTQRAANAAINAKSAMRAEIIFASFYGRGMTIGKFPGWIYLRFGVSVEERRSDSAYSISGRITRWSGQAGGL